jgi:predicted MFS family arabinose efflux permease
VLKVRKVRVGLVAVVLIFIGHFAAYTYISPFLAQSHDAGSIEISSALLSYGVAGVFGNLFCGWLVDRDIRRAVLGTALLLGASMLFLIVSRLHPMATSLAVVAWGFAFGMLPIAIQSWIFRAAPERMETVTALFVAITQIAMGAGALLGGILVEQFGAVGAIWLGATASLAAAVWIYLSFPGEEPIASIRSGR